MSATTLFGIATATEFTKFRRAMLPRVATVMLVGGITAIASSFMWASLQPGSAMAIKLAALVTEDGWAGYLGLTSQIAATAGGIGPGVVLACCLAASLPTARSPGCSRFRSTAPPSLVQNFSSSQGGASHSVSRSSRC